MVGLPLGSFEEGLAEFAWRTMALQNLPLLPDLSFFGYRSNSTSSPVRPDAPSQPTLLHQAVQVFYVGLAGNALARR